MFKRILSIVLVVLIAATLCVGCNNQNNGNNGNNVNNGATDNTSSNLWAGLVGVDENGNWKEVKKVSEPNYASADMTLKEFEDAYRPYTDWRIYQIRTTKSDVKPANGGKAYYVSYKGVKGNDGLSPEKPVILIIGGSLGSVVVHNAVRAILPDLLKDFQVIHLCGKGKVDDSLKDMKGYVQFEYIRDELKDLFALSDLVISRAGANAICELLAVHKPNLLIPLSINASRGDQILNARSFERQGFSIVMEEEELTDASLMDAIRKLYNEKDAYIKAMKQSSQQDSIQTILNLIQQASK